MLPEPLPEPFFARDPEVVAREMLGAYLVHQTREGLAIGRIVETEAYHGMSDPASHAYRGPTPRAAIMFGPPGRAYVHMNYGMYYLLNVVARAADVPAGGVLNRALSPVVGMDLMRRRREAWALARRRTPPAISHDWQLANGPGKLTIAMGIDLAENGRVLTSGPPLYIGRGESIADARVARGPRVGISRAKEHQLRFYVKDEPSVSRG